MCKSILKGRNVPGTDGTYHGTDGTCPRDRRDAHQGCPAKILYVYWFVLSPFRNTLFSWENSHEISTNSELLPARVNYCVVVFLVRQGPFGSLQKHLREAKPGGFQTRVFLSFFRERSRLLSRTLSGLFLVGALNRPRKRKRTNRENPRTIPEQSQENRESPKRDKKRQKRKDKSRPGNPPVWTPPV